MKKWRYCSLAFALLFLIAASTPPAVAQDADGQINGVGEIQ